MLLMFWRRGFDQEIKPKIYDFEGDWGDLSLVEVNPKDEKLFSRYSDFKFFSHIHFILFEFYRVFKYHDQPLYTKLKNSKEKRNYFHLIEIYSGKTMT